MLDISTAVLHEHIVKRQGQARPRWEGFGRRVSTVSIASGPVVRSGRVMMREEGKIV